MADGGVNIRDKPRRYSPIVNKGFNDSILGQGFAVFFKINTFNIAEATQNQIVTPLKCHRVRKWGVCSLLRVMWAHCLHAVEISLRACVCAFLRCKTTVPAFKSSLIDLMFVFFNRRGNIVDSQDNVSRMELDPFQHQGQLHGENKRRICIS